MPEKAPARGRRVQLMDVRGRAGGGNTAMPPSLRFRKFAADLGFWRLTSIRLRWWGSMTMSERERCRLQNSRSGFDFLERVCTPLRVSEWTLALSATCGSEILLFWATFDKAVFSS